MEENWNYINTRAKPHSTASECRRHQSVFTRISESGVFNKFGVRLTRVAGPHKSQMTAHTLAAC